jgi:hypothetical protein
MRWFKGAIGYSDLQEMPLNEIMEWYEEANRMIRVENKNNKV